ncbi:MAG: zinc ABC transporter substrate-binding protein [Parachlamydiaceae bacterium]|nr:zinc ABC transporter substrate-binding protein [Parachlamydiaceae bacterium]
MPLLVILAFCVFTAHAAEPSHHVLVSVSPHKFFVEKIAGDTITIGLMVPAGASAHTYEPTPKQTMTASKADIWFCIGESFEARAAKALKHYRPEMDLVDLRQNMDMISGDPHSGCCCCHANSQDLHIWLSARQAKIQATTIANTLIKHYPEHTHKYQKSLENFLEELTALDVEITQILQPLTDRMILVSHPAYAYFCRDYQLTQWSIEFEGKDPTPFQLNNTLIKARNAHIDKVFIQAQYSSKGAKLVAKELGAKVIMLDPYAESYINSMQEIARQIASGS